jgi:small subunit ribosomal protein S8
MKNHFWNMFANIKNGQLAKRSYIHQKRKKLCELILNILWTEGFIIGYKIEGKNQEKLKIFLKYIENGKPSINNIKVVSKPGKRISYSLKQIWKTDASKNFMIFSTNQGLKTLSECKKLGLGGEPIITIN